MIEIIKSIILDFQEIRLETGTPRRLRIEVIPGKATVCIGVRRGGKSTYLHQSFRRIKVFHFFEFHAAHGWN